MTQLENDNNWWDGRNPDSFFPTVYRLGDDSLEGNLEDQHLSLDERTIRECDLIESLLKPDTGDRILDSPCGYGRHSIELAKRGYDLTGIDLCPNFIEEAKARSIRRTFRGNCQFIKADMRDLPKQLSGFDVCLNMFFSFLC